METKLSIIVLLFFFFVIRKMLRSPGKVFFTTFPIWFDFTAPLIPNIIGPTIRIGTKKKKDS